MLDQFFTDAFLDPNKWKDGDYEDALALFSDAALPSAQVAGLETLTLGANAGDTYETRAARQGIDPLRRAVRSRGRPVRRRGARQVLRARPSSRTRRYVAIVSHGVLFLEDTGDGWRITAYDMKRNDHATEAPAATGATGASGASPTTTGASGAS